MERSLRQTWQPTSASITPANRIRERVDRDLVDDCYPRNRQQRLLIVGGGLGAVQVLDSLSRTNISEQPPL